MGGSDEPALLMTPAPVSETPVWILAYGCGFSTAYSGEKANVGFPAAAIHTREGGACMAVGRDDDLSVALTALRQVLAPLIRDRIAAAEHAGRLVAGDARRAAGRDPQSSQPVEDWDLPSLLRVMFLSWNAAFRDGFSPSDRSAVSTLRSIADRQTRGLPLSASETIRALDVTAGLLAALGAPAPVVPARSLQDAIPPATQSARTTPAATRPKDLTSTATSPDTDADPRPFRIVCWMKPEEAQLVADTYAKREAGEVITSSETIVGTRWYGSEHPDAIKFRAAACMLRYGRSKTREPKQLWIREEEAQAVLGAYSSRTTVDYEHLIHGHGGCAIFYPDDSPDVQRYLANVMLTRWR